MIVAKTMVYRKPELNISIVVKWKTNAFA